MSRTHHPNLRRVHLNRGIRRRRVERLTVADAFDDQSPLDRAAMTDVAIADVLAGREASDAGMMLLPHIQGFCTLCEGAIPHHAMAVKLQPAVPGVPLKRSVKGYCYHCGVLHEITQEHIAGIWIDRGRATTRAKPADLAAHEQSIRELLNHYAQFKAC